MASRSRRAPVSTDKRLRKIPGGGDHGTPERWQHSGRAIQITDRAGILAVRATEENMLDVLALKKLLDEAQIAAGLRLREDYQAAAMAAHVTGSYSGASSARDFFRGEFERNEAQEAAYRRWRKAVMEVGPRLSAVLVSTVCHDIPPLPREVALLQGGLDQLVRWYGMRK
jgi:hypothetical protein